ncbi:MAG: hypothetical protein ABW189_03635 [Rickettsiales bacterium]
MQTLSAIAVAAIIFGAHCFSARAQESDLAPCPYNVQELQRLCMDGVYDSPVSRRQCYRRHDAAACRTLFADCVKNCAFVHSPKILSGSGVSPYEKLLLHRIDKETENVQCERDEDCGSVILLDERGCKTYRPISLLSINETSLEKLLAAYNKYRMAAAKESGSATGDCGEDVPVKSYCEKNPLTEEKRCSPKS